MQSLALIFIAHAVLRWTGDHLLEAAVISGSLLLTMAVVRRFGGWSSAASAWAWLKADPKWLFLVASAPVTMLLLIATSADIPPYSLVVAHAIEAFFLAYAFIAAGRAFWNTGIASIASWFSK